MVRGIDIQTALNYTFADATAEIAQGTIRGFKKGCLDERIRQRFAFLRV
jgi:hypothetical protein